MKQEGEKRTGSRRDPNSHLGRQRGDPDFQTRLGGRAVKKPWHLEKVGWRGTQGGVELEPDLLVTSDREVFSITMSP